MNRDDAFENLCAAVDALEGVGVRAFLVDGTLLGAVREGDFIAHDTDIDLGVFISEHTPMIVLAMKRAGFTHERTLGRLNHGYELSFRRKGIRVDLFFYYKDATGFYHAAWVKRRTPIRYRYDRFSLAPLEFRGRTFLAPSPVEGFLVTKYGPVWRTPVVEWDWKWDPKNAQPWDAA